MYRVLTHVLTCAAVFVSLPRPGAAQTLPSDTTVRRILEEWVATGAVPGLVVGLLEADGTRRYVAVGDSDGDRPLDEHSVFEIGSITKTFTSLVLAYMVEAGDVALDDPVASLLSDSVEIPRGSRPITLADLATHTSGLPRLPMPFLPADPTNPYVDYSAADLYAFLANHTLRREPGAQYEYSNLGSGLLGHALGERAGRPYTTLVRDLILTPLGMEETAFELNGAMRARLTPGHDDAGRAVPNWDFDVLAGAGALRSTAADMLTYMAAFLDPPADALGRAMRAAIVPRVPIADRMEIGLNWVVRDPGTDDAIVWHNGGTGGYHAWAGFMPARGVAVVVLGNATINHDPIGFHLLDPATPPTPPRAEVSVSPATLAEYVGTYEVAPGFALEITLDAGRLRVRATGQGAAPMFASSDSTFFLRAIPAEITFRRDAAGVVTGLVLHQDGRSMPGTKVR